MELTRTAHETHAAPGGFGSDPFASGDNGAPVTVCHGPYSESLPVGGMSVGEVRARFADRFDLHPMSQAFVDGHEVNDDTRVTSGQLLSFMRRAGEKGCVEELHITDNEVRAVSPEGVCATMPLPEFLGKLNPPRMDTGGIMLPDGIKCILGRGRMVIWVYQQPPRVCNLHWVAADSPVPYGPLAKYRSVRIALPYLVLLLPFSPGPDDLPALQPRCECFFRNDPLEGLDDELLFPALLNCSKFRAEAGHPLSWLCTQHVKFEPLAAIKPLQRRMRASLTEILRCLFETSFNYSSEQHEGSSWYTETLRACKDPRIATVEKWEEATKQDPLFALSVPWLKTGRSLAAIAGRIFDICHESSSEVSSLADLSRLVFNNQDELAVF